MSEQEFMQPRRREESQSQELPQVAASQADFDVDDLLDDIDSILEENATSFVQGFVQKGGQ
ncbi:ubiquitin-like protein Pup [Trueperella pecoris]|uniref:Prokaryotic ubiquitin-like protein Pup n=1 Tax=Trueperella pecoris TaxID=2733571 RepID=A0A7M1QT89_9ACTO|nr:ubiquitin-like protein Pup [Trueperella pecoris]QOR44714.1 ubiquitin-like protein Pup [Trueperella pecoris]QOR46715.1 ubiquitin-like protein Pup [Trueperella pecoris]QTG74634.1 ubiquitin-like protein Pup [Trueperella pecoris]